VKKKLLKLSCVIIIVICLLVIGAYFVFTSSFFIKSYLLPALSNATGTKIAAQNVSLSHFPSKIKLDKFSVQFNSKIELKGETVSFNYDLWKLLNNEVEISNLIVKKSTIIFESGESAQRDSFKFCVDNLNISITELANNSTTEVVYDFSFKADRENLFDVNARKISGVVNCFIGKNWIPEQLSLATVFDDVSGFTKAARFDNRKLKMDMELDYFNNNITIKDFVFKEILFSKKVLSNINLKGNLSVSPFAAKVDVLDCLLSSNLLNIVGILYGISFDKTVFDYSGHISYSKDDLQCTGGLKLSNFTVAKPDFKFIEDSSLNVNIKSDLNYNFSKEEIKTNTFNMVIRDKGKKTVELSLLGKFLITWFDNKFSFKSSCSPAANLVIDGFDLSIIENIIARYCDFHLLKGIMNSNIDAFVENKSGNLEIKGSADISKGSGIFNKQQLNDLDLRQEAELDIASFEDIFIKKSETTLFVNSEEAIRLETTGKVNFYKQKGNVRVGIKQLSTGALNKLHISFIKNILGIRELSLNGFIKFDYKEGGRDFILESKLKADDLSFFEVKDAPDIPLISGSLETYLIKERNTLILKKFIFNLDAPKSRIGNLAAAGKLYMSGLERSKLKLYSEGIELKELITIFNSIAGVFNINFENVNLGTDLDLKNITFGPYLTFDCAGAISLDKGLLNADPIYVSINKASILGKIVYDFNAANNNYFNISANASNIDIYPLLSTYDPDVYSNAKGRISRFSMALEGNGISLRNLEKSFKGQVTAVFHDVSIPDNPERNDYIRLLFIPIEVVAQMNVLFGSVNFPIFFNDLVKYSRDIFSRMQNLNLVYGNIYLIAENGKIHFKECFFNSYSNPVSWLKFNGSVGFDRTLDMNTKVKFDNIFIVPLHVSGTVSDPKPDFFDFITAVEDEVSGSGRNDIIDALKLPDTILEHMFYNSDIFFQSAAP